MKQIALSLFAGGLIGVFFSSLKLPLPVPPLAGLFGLVGMMIGEWMLQQLSKIFA